LLPAAKAELFLKGEAVARSRRIEILYPFGERVEGMIEAEEQALVFRSSSRIHPLKLPT